MANEVTSSITSETFANIVQAAQFTLSEKTVIRPLVHNYDMTGSPGLTAQVPNYAAIAAAGLTEGTDAANTAWNTTSTTITATEVGVMVTLTDLATSASVGDLAAAAGRQLGDAMAKKVDDDLAALFSGFSNSVGSGSAEVSIEDFFKASATLRTNNAPGPYTAVIHPYQAHQLKKLLTNAGSTISHNLSEVGNTALKDGFVGRLAGIDIFESTCVTGASGGNYIGAAFSQDALGFVLKRAMKVEAQRDASMRGTEYVGTIAYGVAETFDDYGVGILGDAQL
jgi:N4-gp56 family major capsid protein